MAENFLINLKIKFIKVQIKKSELMYSSNYISSYTYNDFNYLPTQKSYTFPLSLYRTEKEKVKRSARFQTNSSYKENSTNLLSNNI